MMAQHDITPLAQHADSAVGGDSGERETAGYLDEPEPGVYATADREHAAISQSRRYGGGADS
jgi:hypothetical protein